MEKPETKTKQGFTKRKDWKGNKINANEWRQVILWGFDSGLFFDILKHKGLFAVSKKHNPYEPEVHTDWEKEQPEPEENPELKKENQAIADIKVIPDSARDRIIIIN